MSDFSGKVIYIQAVPTGLQGPWGTYNPYGGWLDGISAVTWAQSGGSYSLCLPPGTYDIDFSSGAYVWDGGRAVYLDSFQWYDGDTWNPNWVQTPGDFNSSDFGEAYEAAYASAAPVTVSAGQVVPNIDGVLPAAPPETPNDGDQVPDSHIAAHLGSAGLSSEGIRTMLYPYFPHEVPHPSDVAFPQTTTEICNTGDIVCDAPEAVINLLFRTIRSAKTSI